MSNGPPLLIALDHDRFHAKHVGKTQDGRQFFLTTPFVPARPDTAGSEFIALYIFDAAGNLLDARIDNLGPRSSLNNNEAQNAYDRRLRELGEVAFGRIEMKPFAIERFDTEFGLILRPPEEDDEGWAAEMQPGDFMAFFEPWDSGEYDT